MLQERRNLWGITCSIQLKEIFLENFWLREGDGEGDGEGWGADTVSPLLDIPLSNDLIRYSWESEVAVRSQMIQGRALVEVYRKLCELCIL